MELTKNNTGEKSQADKATSLGLRLAKEADVEAMVTIHQRSFPGYFLTLLGTRFLTELYRGFVSDESGLCCVATRNATVVGFAAGTMEPAGCFKRFLKRQGLHFLLASLPALRRHPFVVGRKLLSAITYRGESPNLEGGGALLSSLAVAPSNEGRGQGAALVHYFCTIAQHQGAKYVYLTTDRDNNVKVNAFYVRQEFQLHSQFEKSGKRRMNCYVRDLSRSIKQPAA